MTVRLINADDIVYESIDSTDTGREERYFGTGIIAVRKEDIDEMPTIELPERKGHWIFGHTLGHSWMKCSECLVSQDGQTACFSYCPNCGARMVKEGEEHV